MKKLLSISLVALIMLLASCSQSGKTRKVERVKLVQDSLVTLRGKSLRTGVVAPIFTNVSNNVYKIGDTVWVYSPTNDIQPNRDWDVKAVNTFGKYQAYVIEEDTITMMSPEDRDRLFRSLNRLDSLFKGKE